MIHCYKLNGFNIVLDSASGSIHSVDDVAYDAIRMFESAGKEETLKHIIGTFDDITEPEAWQLLSDIEELRRLGKLYTADRISAADVKERRAPLKALCMNVSHMCNMVCDYCFAGKGDYGGGGLMPFETGKRAVDFLVKNSGDRTNLYIDFFGGEPLMNWGVVKEIVGYARSLEQDAGKRFSFTLTTNGLLIDDDVIEFSNKEMDNVVLSLDGRPEVNDHSRKLAAGGGSYSKIVPKFSRFVKEREGKEYYIRGTYTRRNLDFVNDILHLADLGFNMISMEPVVSPQGAPNGLGHDCLPALSEQYELLARKMIRRKKEGRGFTFYHYMLDLTGGPCVYKRIAGCGAGTEYLAVTPGGQLYPCHQFVGNPAFLMGDVSAGVTNEKLRGEFRGCSIYSRAQCRECWAGMYCSGGCAAGAYNASGSISGVYELGCELFKKRVECAVMMKVANVVF